MFTKLSKSAQTFYFFVRLYNTTWCLWFLYCILNMFTYFFTVENLGFQKREREQTYEFELPNNMFVGIHVFFFLDWDRFFLYSI